MHILTRFSMWRVALIAAALISSCSGIRMSEEFDRDDAIEQQILTQQEDLFPETDLLALTPEMQSYLAQHIPAGLGALDKLSILRSLLFEEQHLNIQYDDTANLTAAGVFAERRANCLSFVHLYIAMARHVGLEARFHTVRIRPRWDMRGELMVLSEHINATGRVGAGSRYIVDFTPELSFQQLTSSIVSDARARALYFNNLGVEQLIAQDSAAALAYFRNALWLDPTLAIAWNNIGAAFNREGQHELAEYSFKRAFDEDRSSTAPINNLARFYYAQQDEDRAQVYERAIRRSNNRNPYYHYLLGNLAYGEGEFDQARRHYSEAIRRNESEADFFLALGLTYMQLGREPQARQMLVRADALIAGADALYRPSHERVRVIPERTILRAGDPGFILYSNSANDSFSH
jgi:Flp pilus assembly protein TadD